MINISLNGQITLIPEQSTLSEALALWDFANTKVAVAINGEFAPRSTYATHVLQANDQVDVVRPVGGG